MLSFWSVRRWNEKSWTKQDGPDHHTDERVSPNTLQNKYQIHSKNQIRYSKNQICYHKNQILHPNNQIDHRKNQLDQMLIEWTDRNSLEGSVQGCCTQNSSHTLHWGENQADRGFHNMGTEILNRKLWIMLPYLGGEMNSLISLRKYLTTCNKWNIWQVWTWAKIYLDGQDDPRWWGLTGGLFPHLLYGRSIYQLYKIYWDIDQYIIKNLFCHPHTKLLPVSPRI